MLLLLSNSLFTCSGRKYSIVRNSMMNNAPITTWPTPQSLGTNTILILWWHRHHSGRSTSVYSFLRIDKDGIMRWCLNFFFVSMNDDISVPLNELWVGGERIPSQKGFPLWLVINCVLYLHCSYEEPVNDLIIVLIKIFQRC